ncbi:unnamed protein product, partial [Vitis vinifera]
MASPVESVQCFGRKKTAVAVTYCGGHTSQIYAIRQSIAKALVAFYQKYVDEQSKKEIKDILVRYDRTLLLFGNTCINDANGYICDVVMVNMNIIIVLIV